jgi:DNA-binding response OmpR family regulator
MNPAEPRLLVVDGDYEACDALVDALQQAGFCVDFAYDADTALEFARQFEYSHALVAHWPPYLDALGLRRRLGRAARSRPLTWLLVDGLDDALAEAATQAGYHALQPYHTSPDKLLTALAQDSALSPVECVAA